MACTLVAGSINMDVVTRVRVHPKPGETVPGLGLAYNSILFATYDFSAPDCPRGALYDTMHYSCRNHLYGERFGWQTVRYGTALYSIANMKGFS